MKILITGESSLLYLSGTKGWNRALRTACKKTGLSLLYNQYSKMPWDVSDEFDEKIVDKIMENKF